MKKILPLNKENAVALFGIHSYKALMMEWGSGDMLAHNPVNLSDALIARGVKPEKNALNLATRWTAAHGRELACPPE